MPVIQYSGRQSRRIGGNLGYIVSSTVTLGLQKAREKEKKAMKFILDCLLQNYSLLTFTGTSAHF